MYFLEKLVFVFNHKRIVCSSRYKIFLKNKKRIMHSVKKTWKKHRRKHRVLKKRHKTLGDPLNPDQPL